MAFRSPLKLLKISRLKVYSNLLRLHPLRLRHCHPRYQVGSSSSPSINSLTEPEVEPEPAPPAPSPKKIAIQSGPRIVASPYAKKLAAEANVSLVRKKLPTELCHCPIGRCHGFGSRWTHRCRGCSKPHQQWNGKIKTCSRVGRTLHGYTIEPNPSSYCRAINRIKTDDSSLLSDSRMLCG